MDSLEKEKTFVKSTPGSLVIGKTKGGVFLSFPWKQLRVMRWCVYEHLYFLVQANWTTWFSSTTCLPGSQSSLSLPATSHHSSLDLRVVPDFNRAKMRWLHTLCTPNRAPLKQEVPSICLFWKHLLNSYCEGDTFLDIRTAQWTQRRKDF